MTAKLIAVHAVQLIIAGELTTIKPSFPLILEDEKQIQHLRNAGAVRDPEENEARLFNDKTPNASLKQVMAQDTAALTAEDLSKMKKADLVALAAKEDIAIDTAATNSVIVKSIEDARKAKAEDAGDLV